MCGVFGKICGDSRGWDGLVLPASGPRAGEPIFPTRDPVNVLPLTILFSSLLAVFFIVAFVMEWRRGARTSVERESLLPLDDGGEPDATRRTGPGH